jgi:hypothetical protein
MILYETFNYVDVQITDKGTCNSWNSGNALIGLINASGNVAITPPGRNTGAWSASQEGWRFKNEMTTGVYNYVICDPAEAGVATFSTDVIKNDLLPTAPQTVTIYRSMDDAVSGINAIDVMAYTNISVFHEELFALVNGSITKIILKEVDCAVDCAVDFDQDTVPTQFEDLNNDGDLANDDTDGLSNFLDTDDDGDFVLTQYEYVFLNGRNSRDMPLDTDGDGIPNYLDNDDDGDGTLTIDEDYDGNKNPSNDDTNNNGITDYLEAAVNLDTAKFDLHRFIHLYPNPTHDVLTISNTTGFSISEVSIYNVAGMCVQKLLDNQFEDQINVSILAPGIYFLKIKVDTVTLDYKFIKK